MKRRRGSARGTIPKLRYNFWRSDDFFSEPSRAWCAPPRSVHFCLRISRRGSACYVASALHAPPPLMEKNIIRLRRSDMTQRRNSPFSDIPLWYGTMFGGGMIQPNTLSTFSMCGVHMVGRVVLLARWIEGSAIHSTRTYVRGKFRPPSLCTNSVALCVG